MKGSMKLPEGWVRHPIKKVCRLREDTLELSSLGNELVTLFSVPAYDDSGKPELINANNIGSSKNVTRPGDVLFCKMNPRINRVWIIDEVKTKYSLCSSEFLPLVPNEQINPKFLSYILKSPYFQQYAKQKAKAATKSRERVNPKEVLEIPILYPEKVELQSTIATDLDRKMTEAEKMRQAALRQKEAASAMQGAILREAFPWKEGEKLPEGWKWEKIKGHISDSQSGLACGDKSKKDGYPHLRMNNISNDGKLDLALLWRIPATEQEIAKFSVQQGDILFNNTNSPALVGKSFIFNLESNETYLFSNHLTRIKTKPSLKPQYLLYWINILWQKKYFENYCDTWVNQAAIRVEDRLFPKIIPLPPTLSDQTAIANDIERKIGEAEKLGQAADRQFETAEALPGAILRDVFDFEEEGK